MNTIRIKIGLKLNRKEASVNRFHVKGALDIVLSSLKNLKRSQKNCLRNHEKPIGI